MTKKPTEKQLYIIVSDVLMYLQESKAINIASNNDEGEVLIEEIVDIFNKLYTEQTDIEW